MRLYSILLLGTLPAFVTLSLVLLLAIDSSLVVDGWLLMVLLLLLWLSLWLLACAASHWC